MSDDSKMDSFLGLMEVALEDSENLLTFSRPYLYWVIQFCYWQYLYNRTEVKQRRGFNPKRRGTFIWRVCLKAKGF